MIKHFTVLIPAFFWASLSFAQNNTPVPTPAFGKVDIADLQLKQCDFEPDANAMVLFDKANVYFDFQYNVVMERHKRIKIFNDKGKDEANIRIPYYAFAGNSVLESITGVQAQTINEVNGKPEVTKLESKLIYTEVIDKVQKALVFAFPNVKPGSIIEFKYTWETRSFGLPDWFFQSKLPTRYTELTTEIPEVFFYKTQIRGRLPFAVNKTGFGDSKTIGTGMDAVTVLVNDQTRAMVNVPSLADEPYMRSRVDNLACILFQLTSIRPIGGFVHTGADSWAKIGGVLADDEDFGSQLKRKLKDEEAIIAKAKTMKTDDERIAYIFNEVKNRMKWDETDRWYTNDGTTKAWEKQSGNSAEINLILYHLLKQSGLKVYPMIVSTREHGRVNMAYPFLYQFNRAVAYIPVDSTKKYILDATNKYNLYNETPDDLLNSSGLYISKDDKVYDLLFIKKEEPARQTILVTAEIKPDGKMEGAADVSSSSYFKINSVERYKKDGEDKYKVYLKDNDNNMTISAVKIENMDVDTLPLSQKINFKLSLTGSDGDYIYFSPNLFTSLKSNPFLSENRSTDIDFGYRSSYSINGSYKVPAGYKTEALPKNMTLIMPDKSITFKRFVVEQDGAITVRYLINYNKTVYYKEEYPEFHEFYKKMNEMLNEQIVLKKG